MRGQILPVIDLRRLLQQRSLADEFADSGRLLREEYEHWIEQTEKVFAGDAPTKVDASVTEHLLKWLVETNSSSQVLMEALAKARGLNERSSSSFRFGPLPCLVLCRRKILTTRDFGSTLKSTKSYDAKTRGF